MNTAQALLISSQAKSMMSGIWWFSGNQKKLARYHGACNFIEHQIALFADENATAEEIEQTCFYFFQALAEVDRRFIYCMDAAKYIDAPLAWSSPTGLKFAREVVEYA